MRVSGFGFRVAGACWFAMALFVTTPVAVCTPAPAALAVAVRGQPPACAVSIPESPGPTERHAADELTNYVFRLTGVALPIVTNLPPSRPAPSRISIRIAAGFPESGYRIRVRDGNELEITGGKRGVLFAVYNLLERFGGVGWYASWRTVVPELDAFLVPSALDDWQTPAFEMREDYWFDAFDGDYAAHNRLDGDMMRFEEKHGGRSSMRFGGGLGNAHTFHFLMPVEEFYAEHPEYYCEVNGERRRTEWQLCLSNPDVLRIVTARVKERIASDPAARYFGVSQEDNMNYCRCGKCAAIDAEEESHAGALVRFVNALAAEVGKDYPDAVIETLAYMYSRKPPKKTRLADNAIVCLCASGVEYSKSLAASEDESAKAFLDDLRGWAAQSRMLYLWDYDTNFTHFMLPFPNVYVMRDNFRLYRNCGVKALFAEGGYVGQHADFAELKAWLTAKWMWDPDIEPEPLIDRFMKGYYGAAAPFVREYFDAVEALPKRWLGIAQGVDAEWLSDEFLAWADGIWQKALEAVADDPECAFNVRMGRLSIVYPRFMRGMRRVEKKFWLCDKPAEYARLAEAKRDFEWIEARTREAKPYVSFSEGLTAVMMVAKWREALEKPLPEKGADSAEFSLDDMSFSPPEEKRGEIVEWPDAIGGRAYRISNGHQAWCATKRFNDVALEDATNYVVRFRVKVLKTPEAGKLGSSTAFRAGLYDDTLRRNVPFQATFADVSGDWQWFEIPFRWPMQEHGAYFWIAPAMPEGEGGALSPNPGFKAILIDRCALERLTHD